MVEIKKSYCGLCHPRCGTLLHIEDGKIVKVTGDPDHPVTRGVVCERGRLMPDHVHHPQRLNHPLKRKGEKGGGQWQRLTADYTPGKVAQITGIPAELAVKAARMYADAKPATIPWGYGLDKQGINATQCARARAIISTPTGRIRQKVRVSDSIREDMVDLQHGWWFPESDEKLPELFRVFESNANILCPDDPEVCSQETGSWPHSALLCNIEKEKTSD